MDFSGPEPADFANVESLNHAFLLQLRAPIRGRRLRCQLPSPVRELVKALTDLHVERLSVTPFLLLSLREHDEDYWRGLTSDDRNFDLLAVNDGDAEEAQLAAAGLAFLWQLARRNPYAARLVSGATLNRCEHLGDCTLLQLLQRITGRSDLMQPRQADNEEFWRKLLGPGLSSEREVRRAAHLAALQSILTDEPAVRYRPTRAAACSTAVPSLQVADRQQPS